jgi:hypothetical protein
MADIQTINKIKIGDTTYDVQTSTLGGLTPDKYQANNLVTSVSETSDDTHYPSAKCVYDLMCDIETLLSKI